MNTPHPDQAEFALLQRTLAAGDDLDPDRPPLAARESELLAAHGREWAAPAIDAGASAYSFRDGALDEVTLSVADFLRQGRAILDHTTARRFRLTAAAGNLGALAASDLLADVRGLSFGDASEWLEAPDLRALAASPHLGRIADLHVNGGYPELWDGIDALLRAPSLGPLERLSIHGVTIYGRGLGPVTANPALSSLRELSLILPDFRAADFSSLGLAENLHGVRTFEIGSSTGRGVEGLFARGGFPNLAYLGMHIYDHAEDIFLNLPDNPAGRHLRRVRCGYVSEETLAAFLRLPVARSAARLVLAHRPGAPEGAGPPRFAYPGGEFRLEPHDLPMETCHVVRAADLPDVRWFGLHMSYRAGGLFDWPGVSRLEVLDLYGSASDESIAGLARYKTLSSLRRLDVTADGLDLRPLAAAAHLAGLERLDFSPWTPVESLDALEASPLAGAAAASIHRARTAPPPVEEVYDADGE